LHEGVLLKGDSSLLKPGRDLLDIRNFPAEHGVRRRSEILRLGDSDHGFTGSYDQRKHVIADELKAEFAFVEAFCFRGIFSGNEANDLAGSQHLHPPLAPADESMQGIVPQKKWPRSRIAATCAQFFSGS